MGYVYILFFLPLSSEHKKSNIEHEGAEIWVKIYKENSSFIKSR